MGKSFFVLLCVAVVCQGCLTAAPGVGGKTKAETTFENTQESSIDPVTQEVVPGETLKYNRKVELPAGVSLEGNDGMAVGVAADGSYNINVNQEGKIDTTVQAQMIPALAEIQAATTRAIIEGLVNALPAILSQYFTGTQAGAAADGIAKQQRLDSVLNALRPIIEAEVNRQSSQPSLVPEPPLTGAIGAP